MAFVVLNRNYSVGDWTYGCGQCVEVPDWLARQTISSGDARLARKNEESLVVNASQPRDIPEPAKVGSEEIPRRGPGRPRKTY